MRAGDKILQATLIEYTPRTPRTRRRHQIRERLYEILHEAPMGRYSKETFMLQMRDEGLAETAEQVQEVIAAEVKDHSIGDVEGILIDFD